MIYNQLKKKLCLFFLLKSIYLLLDCKKLHFLIVKGLVIYTHNIFKEF